MSQSVYRFWKWTKPNPIIKSARKPPLLNENDIKKDTAKNAEKKGIYNPPSDKRSVCNERIANRYMIIQTAINPFISTESYIDDLRIQDKFLRPKDSNIKDVE